MKNNKRKLAVISLVVMMMITAVGYAAFSDSLTVAGAANSASFDVKFVLPIALPLSEGGTQDTIEVVGENAKSASTQNPFDTLLVGVFNLKPGETRTLTGYIYNNGTIPAYTDAAVVTGAAEHFNVSVEVPASIAAKTSQPCHVKVSLKAPYDEESEGAPSYTDSFAVNFSYHQ